MGTPISFHNLVTPGDAPVNEYGWGFGNGIAHSDSNTTYAYGAAGTYNITLVVQDTNGCAANATKNNYITILPSPQAAFTATPPTSCDSEQLVTFTNQSTGTGLTYSWKLTDSLTSTEQNPTHIYHNQTQTVVLTVTDTSGCTSKASQKIYVLNVVANFNLTYGVSCVGTKLTFANTSTDMPGNSYTWTFGDGTSSNAATPHKTYAASGSYDVKLVVKNGTCIDSITKPDAVVVTPGIGSSSSSFTQTNTISCGDPLTVDFKNTTTGGNAYQWSFSNGDSSTAENPSVTFTNPGHYSVSLTVTDTISGCVVTGVSTNIITIGKPVALFTFFDTVTCANAAIALANHSTNATSYIWTFGDGDSSTEVSPHHTYTSNGNYTISLTAINSAGCDSTISIAGSIHVDSIAVDFKVNATFSPCPPFACILHSKCAPSVNKFLWDFGDGYTDVVANPIHIYFHPGIYTIRLIGHTATGCVDTIVYKDLITVQGPTGLFTATPTTGCVPLTVHFTDTVSSNTKSFWCDLGDGNVIADSLSFSNTYTGVRVYHPQFVLVDHVGCTVPYSIDSIITHDITPFQVKDTSVCAGVTLNTSLSQNGNHYKWSPADFLSCDSCINVAINDTGTTKYKIVGTNQFGCQAVQNMQVNVVPLPQLNDTISYSLCNKDSFKIFAGNASRISWSPSLYLSDTTSLNPLCTPSASITYTVKAFNSLGCMVSAVVPITVGTKVNLSLTDDTIVCVGSNIQLHSKLGFSSSVGIQYTWSPASYLNSANIADPVASMGNSPEVFQLIASSGHCIPDTQTVTVNVVAMPDMEVSPKIFTTPNAETELYAQSHQQLTYQWFSNDPMNCETESCDRTFIYPTESGIVTVEGTSKYGCVVKASVPIEVQGCDANTIYMPNTFTPNGDGLNDKFLIRSKTLSSLAFFRIFDEWGQLVFETNKLDEGWDGTIAGKPAALAVYVYTLEGKCQNGYNVTKSGNVTVVR